MSSHTHPATGIFLQKTWGGPGLNFVSQAHVRLFETGAPPTVGCPPPPGSAALSTADFHTQTQHPALWDLDVCHFSMLYFLLIFKLDSLLQSLSCFSDVDGRHVTDK